VNKPGVEILPAVPSSEFPVPAIVAAAGEKAREHFLEFLAPPSGSRTHAQHLPARIPRSSQESHFPSGKSCICQKHPCVRTTLRRDGKTRSGFPGKNCVSHAATLGCGKEIWKEGVVA